MINLATLTGAIKVALGNETAGLFSNDDKLCEKFLEAGKLEGEESWRRLAGEVLESSGRGVLVGSQGVLGSTGPEGERTFG